MEMNIARAILFETGILAWSFLCLSANFQKNLGFLFYAFVSKGMQTLRVDQSRILLHLSDFQIIYPIDYEPFMQN